MTVLTASFLRMTANNSCLAADN